MRLTGKSDSPGLSSRPHQLRHQRGMGPHRAGHGQTRGILQLLRGALS